MPNYELRRNACQSVEQSKKRVTFVHNQGAAEISRRSKGLLSELHLNMDDEEV